MMTPRDYIKLIDFGASKEYVSGKGATIFSGIAMTRSYAAPEQIDGTYEKLGPWTDFYALGATLYRMLTNKVPPSFTDLNDDKSDDKHIVLSMPHVSERTRNLVLWMMQLDRTKRPQRANDVVRYLNTSICIPNAHNAPNEYTYQQSKNTDENTVLEELPQLSVGKNILRFDAEGNGDWQYVTVDSNQEWKVFCSSQWVELYKFNSSFRVCVGENPGLNERWSLIKVTAGKFVRTIDVVQKGKPVTEYLHSKNESSSSSTIKKNDEEFSFVGCFYIIIILSFIVYVLEKIMS